MTPQERYTKLTEHLKEENPVLLDTIELYRKLDRLGWNSGLLDANDSYASRISWWPLISILGTFSAGKSSFINTYIGKQVQDTGNQAIDEKFTVICYGPNEETITLPGLALDADPRFPFYNIGEKINEVDPGEGDRVDAYLQLKTIKAAPLRGKILIDSPGFDADSQRDAVLRITHHIIDMSDLVLIFFDARHPEPGAMRDTLEHLVGGTIDRHDANKFLYILNQIDTAAKEDNPEEVIGAWQRALSQKGLFGGNFFTIYNEQAAVPINDEALAQRFKRKKDEDLARIITRMNTVSNERAYRIAKAVETIANTLEKDKLPKLKQALRQWRKRVIWTESLLWALVGALAVTAQIQSDFLVEAARDLAASPTIGISAAISFFVIAVFIHFKLRNWAARGVARAWSQKDEDIARAIAHNNVWWHPLFSDTPRGWGRKAHRLIESVKEGSRQVIQKLNDRFAAPSGDRNTSQQNTPQQKKETE